MQNTTVYKAHTKEIVKAATFDYKTILKERNKVSRNYMEWFPSSDFKNFVKEIKAVVDPMVKEFKQKQAARRLSRTHSSTKGSLDVNKLHKYKFDDNLFKSVMWTEDDKNHGVIVLVDHSKSMYSQMETVQRQILILASFCKRIAVPFDIYGFTDLQAHEVETTSDTAVDNANLIELLSSRMTKSEYNQAYRQIFWMMFYNKKVQIAPCHTWYDELNYTPLIGALGHMFVKVKDFRNRYNVEKMNLVVITDGMNNGTYNFHSDQDHYYRNKTAIDINGLIIVNKSANHRNVEIIIKELRKKDITVVNYHILPTEKEVKSYLKSQIHVMDRNSSATKKSLDLTMRGFKKEGMLIYDEISGYNRRFIFASNVYGFSKRKPYLCAIFQRK